MRNIIFIFLLILMFSGCSMFSGSLETDFSIDEPQEVSCDYWLVSFCDGHFVREFVIRDSSTKFSLDLPKNVVLGIVAYPVKGDRKFLPFGAVYPFDNRLTQKDGFAAYIADRLYRSAVNKPEVVQDFISRFNWHRFIEECRKFYDPWELDGDRIAKAIAAGTFKKTDLKLVVE